ncbi:hypothetical protein BON22_1671 [Cyberlindnera fabianii]|uniref:Uncharacterized protein n=1 Tax=Cyberlindnera fabianii TaxID=36022 RepID=A0A1V2LB52_CYBFA|nr:hypothetical protein BON22_1671 [Cyberlindnera fabianii]
MSSSLGGSGGGLAAMMHELTNGAATGTGIVQLVPKVKKLLGLETVPSYLVDYATSVQHSLFGSYPTHKDIAPSSIFTAVFVILMFAHTYIFVKNISRGHKFWLSIGFIFHALLRWLGFAFRVRWAQDIQRLKIGIASEVFLIIPMVFLASFNLVLAQRIFTWRHPHIGSKSWFWNAMILVYVIVIGVVVMGVLGAVIPYLYFLSEKRFSMCKKAAQAAAVLCTVYSLGALLLVISAFVLPPSAAARQIWTFQPWWIESFGIFYFPPKNAARDAEETFARREPDSADAVRIIPSTTHYTNTLEKTQSVTSKSGKLGHNHSIFIICLTTLFLLVSSAFRCASTFIDDTYANESWIFRPVVMYIMFGLFEAIVSIIYLTSRVDLRFYRPDKIRKGICGSKKSEADTFQDDRSREDKPYTDILHNDHSSTE